MPSERVIDDLARTLARVYVRDQMKLQGPNINPAQSAEISRRAEELMDKDPSFLRRAKAAVKR